MKKDKPLGKISSLLSPEKRRQLAQWIRDGLDTPGIEESKHTFFDLHTEDHCLVCVLGAAIVGRHGGNVKKVERLINQAEDRGSGRIDFSKRSLGIPSSIAERIDYLHLFSEATAKEIATMLEKGTLKIQER